MQSEFACHIGLRGKLFCRACWVKGTDALDPMSEEPPQPGGSRAGSESAPASPTASENQSEDGEGSDTGSKKGKGKGKGRGKKAKETMQQMVTRVKAFMTVIPQEILMLII